MNQMVMGMSGSHMWLSGIDILALDELAFLGPGVRTVRTIKDYGHWDCQVDRDSEDGISDGVFVQGILHVSFPENFNVFCVYAAYTLEEVDEKTKPFRASVNHAVGDNASSLDVSMALILHCETLMFLVLDSCL